MMADSQVWIGIMRYGIACIVCWALMLVPVKANDGLIADNLRIETQTDVYGVEKQVVIGQLTNQTEKAYADVFLEASLVFNDQSIADAYGYLVNQCGVAIVDDPLQPNETVNFVLDIDSEAPLTDKQIASLTYEVFPNGTEIEAEPTTSTLTDAIRQIDAQEVVDVEWVNDTTLRYGVGCDSRIFTTYQWYEYDLTTQKITVLQAHPNAELLTERVIQATGVTRLSADRTQEDPSLLEKSYFTYIPNTTRILWQNDKHDLFTAERDGNTFIQEVHTFLHQYSLRGFIFTPTNNFVAYYFGAYGEPVRYLTARPDGQLISQVITVNTPSNTVPGVQVDAQRVIISGTFNDVSGYFFQSTVTPEQELLFEVNAEELAGNNYPAPLYFRQNSTTRYIYIIRPIDGQATLQCFQYESKTLTSLNALPLQLQNDERAWATLSPDGTKMALYAQGRHSGLWIQDVTCS